MISKILAIGSIASAALAIVAFASLIIKPIRKRLLGPKAESEALKCLIRSHMTNIYYRHAATCEIRQYEFENFSLLYKEYKVLGGNSFVDKIYEEVVEHWTIIPG